MRLTVESKTHDTNASLNSSARQERCVIAQERYYTFRRTMLKWQFAAFVILGVGILAALLALWRQAVDTARLTRRQMVDSVYSIGLETDKLAMQTPAFRRYFAPSADYFTASKLPAQEKVASISQAEQEKKWKDGQLNSKQDFDAFTAGTAPDTATRATEEANNKALVWASAGFQSDYMEYVFIHRNLYEPDEWQGWWQFLCQEYDDSPILRQFLARYEDTDWYTFLPAVRSTTAGRQRYFDNPKLSGRQF